MLARALAFEPGRPEILPAPVSPNDGIGMSGIAARGEVNIFSALVRTSGKSANTLVVTNGRVLLRYVDPARLADGEPAPTAPWLVRKDIVHPR